jgi:hypothetical protein
VRNDDPDESDRAADRNGGAGRERRTEKRRALSPDDVESVRLGAVFAEVQEIQRPRQPGKRRERDGDERCRTDERLIAAHVEVAHQPAEGAERLGKIREILHEQNQRGKERVHCHTGEQQHVGGEPAVARLREGIDDCHGAEGADEACRRDRR